MLTTYYPNGLPYIVEERINGKRNGTVYIYNVTGQEISTIWYNYIQICSFEYHKNNKRHNEHGPACISWADGKIYHMSYWQNGLLHNLHGPARIRWYDYGQTYCFTYWQNGLQHNLHGPAYMYINLIRILRYYYFGKLIKEYEF